jgi:hypothetical protein
MKNRRSASKKDKSSKNTSPVDYVTVYSQFFHARPDAVIPGMNGDFRIVDGFDYGLRTTTDSGTGRYLNEGI